MNKRGQFFLIAALIISGIILSFAAVQISTKNVQKEDTKVYDLSKEIDFESNQVIDYGVYKSLAREQLKNNLTSLIDYYSASNPDTDILVVYGNPNYYQTWSYTHKLVASSGIGGTAKTNSFESNFLDLTSNTTITHGNVVTVRSGSSAINFNLNPGENFYIVLQKEIGGEKIVVSE